MRHSRFVAAFALLCALLAPAPALAQGGANPSIKKIGPARVSVGDPDFTLRVAGEGFDAGSVVQLDGEPLETRFISKKRLYARVPTSATAAAGTSSITVRTGAGATSDAKT